eukprot:Gregarina_sp_Pseudo_9__2489@NODE_2769_length_879_cov_7_316667_g2534_i0_p1_GENE_NODE_2769_length_879_cov_7_316667_g2534_i0NODE_2769_length_879_cov_7_316667_g2534_i0_p1_ORF_typecomplete_len253_score54_40RNase_Zc3h12a/PF11977_8/1_3e03RNase_Zc3h12a/PF11977_8/7_3e05PRORP/PF16953_5/0_00013_NODE_2769_length_879_cov_7_316667_g2534_i025783
MSYDGVSSENLLIRYNLPDFSTLQQAKQIYAPPPGYTWRPVVVDALNFLAKEDGPEWFQRSYGGTSMARFAAFLIAVGVRTVKFTLSRAIVDLLLDRNPLPHTQKDKNDFVWLFTREYIVVAPSWMNHEDVKIATNNDKEALELFQLPCYSRVSSSANANPWKVNDDLITLHVGFELGSVFVSSDKFRDLKSYLPNTSLTYMNRTLRSRQVCATCVDRQANVWRVEPMYQIALTRTELPFWVKMDELHQQLP